MGLREEFFHCSSIPATYRDRLALTRGPKQKQKISGIKIKNPEKTKRNKKIVLYKSKAWCQRTVKG
jgi:hypothetical protein